MCATCGCGQAEHEHEHEHEHGHGRHIDLERRVLAANLAHAERVRAHLDAQGITMLNLLSAPGSGKTTLLERTIRERAGAGEISVIEGDQATERDAERIRRAGARAVQVNTGTGCHLDAHMIEHALDELRPAAGGLLFVENVGNLVCPALFDLGEVAKVVVTSVTEGDDKPLKYPHMFAACELVIVNKLDLLPYVSFDLARFERDAQRANAKLEMIALSATNGDSFRDWHAWLDARIEARSQLRSASAP